MMISASQKCFYMGNKWCLVFSKDAAECLEDKAYKVEIYLMDEIYKFAKQKKSCIVKMSYLFVYKARYIVKKLDVLYNKPDKSKKFAQQEEHYERE